MLELNIKCESIEDARLHLSGPQYHNLISDFYAALRSARKHGSDADVLLQVEHWLPDLARAVDDNTGPY